MVALAEVSLASAQRPAMFETEAIDAKVAALLKRMTLAAKLGQLTQFSNGAATGPGGAKVDQKELAARADSARSSTSPGHASATSCSGRRWKNRG